jgi:hypothetical protein
LVTRLVLALLPGPVVKLKRFGGGQQAVSKGSTMSIALLVTKVSMTKRLDVEAVVRGRVPSLRAAIQKGIEAVRMPVV